MGLSSNILWHQSDKEALKSILKTKQFYYSYARETMPGVDFPVAFPMISLCDVPFSEISEYMDKYKGYSIGISREWGVKNGFNPVWYCEKSSRIQTELVKLFATAIKNDHPGSEKIAAMKTFSYTKMVEGPLESQNYESYRFYDEREFRLVFPFEKAITLDIPTILTGEEDIKKYKEEHDGNKFVQKGNKIYGKSFTWSDIKYIIVKDRAEIKEFKDYLETLNCTNESIMLFDHVQIRHDFLGIAHFKILNPAEDVDDTNGVNRA